MSEATPAAALPRLVVVGNGMVGQRLLERLVAAAPAYRITVLCEEPRAAYDRVALTSFFSGKTAEELSLVPAGFFEEHGIDSAAGRARRRDRPGQPATHDQHR